MCIIQNPWNQVRVKPRNFIPMKFNDFTVPQLTYWQTFCPTIWNGIMSDKRLDFTLRHNAQRHLDQSEDWIVLESLVTRTCNVWGNEFPAILTGIGRNFKICLNVNNHGVFLLLLIQYVLLHHVRFDTYVVFIIRFSPFSTIILQFNMF